MMSETTSQAEGSEASIAEAAGAMRERLEAVARLNAEKAHVWNCLRCTYDLRGQYAARGEREQSVCSECGLVFKWFDLLTRDQHVVKGFIEHTRGFWKTFVAAWRTWIWTLWPWWFWRRISIERPMRVRRAWLWFLIVFGLPRLVMTLLHLVPAVGVWLGWWGPRGAAISAPWSAFLFAGFRRLDWNGTVVWAFDRWPPPILALVAASITVSMMLLSLPITLGKAKVHKLHIMRASIYGLSPLVLPTGLHALVESLQTLGYILRYWGIQSFRDIFDGFADFVEGAAELWPLWGPAMAIWFAVYWWFVVALGWRIENPKPVWGVLMFGAFLAALSALLLQEEMIEVIANWLY